jgi:preprotein translocase subunit SecG
MNTTLTTIIVLVQVLSALTIVGLVLLQHGKGADMGAAFGSGASGSLFGATGSSNFLSKSTGIAAAIFFSATLGLSLVSNGRHATISGGVLDNLPTVPVAPAPAASVPAAAPAASSAVGSAPATSAAAPAASTEQAAKTAPATTQSNQIPK